MSKKIKNEKEKEEEEDEGRKGKKGERKGEGPESHLEQRCCLSPWVSTANSTEGNYVITNRMLAPVRTPDAAPSLELPCAQRSGFQGFPVTIGRTISWTAFLRKGGVKNGLGNELTLIYRSAPNPVSILET